MSFVFTSQHELFIKRMLENQEQEQKGYELLLKKDYFAEFFDHLRDVGLFDVSRLPGPQQAPEPGYVRIPYWAPLDYLVACARRAGELPDLELANKVLSVIRKCAEVKTPEGEPLNNYHTARKFAEIFGLLPTSIVLLEDLDSIQLWLADPYDRGLLCNALDKGLMSSMLTSSSPDDWAKAVRTLDLCTTLKPGKGDDQLIPVADDYWLKELISHHSSALGEKVGAQAADIFIDRLNQIFGASSRENLGYLFRPAIEDHPQNQSWHEAENLCVEGLRDVLLAWIDTKPSKARVFVKSIFHGESEIVRRIAIHVINHRWEILQNLFLEAISPEIFGLGHLHELYQLLNSHFQGLQSIHQDSVVDAISKIAIPETADNPVRLLRLIQRRWLSAIQGKGHAHADHWFAQLGQGDDAVGVSSHPDFISYMETRWGDGDSLYQIDELLAFAESKEIVKVLNDFEQVDRWNGPSTRALVQMLEAAVLQNPILFLGNIELFLGAKRPYQYGLINALKQLWDKSGTSHTDLDWNKTWAQILGFISDLIGPESFWDEQVEECRDLSPDRNWIPPVVADFLHAGTRDDAHAYAPKFLPKALKLIELLLDRADSCETANEDSMTAAINSPKGKAIEALISHALRQCRISDKEFGGHQISWSELQPVFDRELEKTHGHNFEFSTLVAANLPYFEYLSPAWLADHIKDIFPVEFQDNFSSAIGGLAYAPASKSIYKLLVESGVIDAGQEMFKGKEKYEDRLVERIALAYISGDEELDSARFTYWFETEDIDALITVSHYFWSVSKQQLEDSHVARIMLYWEKCSEFVRLKNIQKDRLLSSLSRLACYLTTIGPKEEALLLEVAPYAHVGHNSDWLFEEMNRLADDNPKEVLKVVNCLLDSYEPIFDFEDRLKSIARKLASHQLREDALRIINRLRRINGMSELFEELSVASGN